ncbi:MAG: pyrimidine dimer DNA glycosylase/endonuclease V [Gammaproteobacteria bacterium]|nr:pyrimidine dimer DNA glycosylase/endonuclease V [Gammaproteobacteria bacterium]MBU1980194.1 pyrimidine dimer DNA glycosylase/endonuclease V [Gammaproteobacteria bacterium]
MRLWTLHPQYLDAQGLVAVWREALLGQKVLLGQTSGYRNHPQLARFRALDEPVAGIASYLAGVHADALRRSYHFDASKIVEPRWLGQIEATTGQLAYEWTHLCRKLALRDPVRLAGFSNVEIPEAHPLFCVVEGGIASWEKI